MLHLVHIQLKVMYCQNAKPAIDLNNFMTEIDGVHNGGPFDFSIKSLAGDDDFKSVMNLANKGGVSDIQMDGQVIECPMDVDLFIEYWAGQNRAILAPNTQKG